MQRVEPSYEQDWKIGGVGNTEYTDTGLSEKDGVEPMNDSKLVGGLTTEFAEATKEAQAFPDDLEVKRDGILSLHLPETPADGFKGTVEFKDFILKTNEAISGEYAEFLARKNQLRQRDPEQPDKFVASIVTECSDGRNSELQFMDREELLARFDHEWLPFAGNVIFPEFERLEHSDDWDSLRAKDPALKEEFFSRLDFIYGRKIKEAVAEYKKGETSRINIEFQSHFQAHHDHDDVHGGVLHDTPVQDPHGCGAHKGNLLNAQLESIKDCLVTTSWLRERYPEEYKNGLFRVFHTTHDTSKQGAVYRAFHVNESLPQDVRDKYEELFYYSAQIFEAPKAVDEQRGIVREYKGNPTSIETEDHDEQVVRVSKNHYASTLNGQSVMEMSWTDSSAILASDVKKLLGIIERNFRTRHPDKPSIVHFDLEKGNEQEAEVLAQTMDILNQDDDLAEKMENGLLHFVVTETDRSNYQMKIVK